jgi:hypothetical protein
VTAWSVQRQLRNGTGRGIKLPEDEDQDEEVYRDRQRQGALTPPLQRPPSATISNYASPHDTSPIPFRTTQTQSRSLSQSQPRSWIPQNQDQDQEPIPDPKHVHWSNPSHITLPLPPHDQHGLLPPSSASEPTPAQARTLTSVGLAFAAASGVLSGMSLILAKAAVELLVLTLDWWRTGKGENQFVRAESWVLVGGLGVMGVLQLVYLNYSLTFASPALICPLAFCFFNLSSIFGRSSIHTEGTQKAVANMNRWTGVLRPIWKIGSISNRPRLTWCPSPSGRGMGGISRSTYGRWSRYGYMG